ncbi:hypothetical protein POJ06DRAFT_271802 [Lipomyces tetrasporus]|uniref:Chromo domain-containing protein n=1 Tax=Lipomyces tetrasporus TaxID=54092 RepID=A0AAD7QKV8_9ASCO|nr:uncharacterized protein POJ06DRAFT_271802 [Lipomyces tetrasporus]KAJ8096780.1 hypothetical protein POJ06DRAFT_271802 [Lipomyces tetrasporus]
MSVTERPQMNGQMERMIQVIRQLIRQKLDDEVCELHSEAIEDDVYEIDGICRSQTRMNEYLVKWKNSDSSHNFLVSTKDVLALAAVPTLPNYCYKPQRH